MGSYPRPSRELHRPSRSTVLTIVGATSGRLVRDDKGQRVPNIWDQEATKYCAYAALAKTAVKPGDDFAHDLHHQALLVVHKALREIEEKDDVSIVTYNDRHTHDDILSLFDRAIKIAKEFESEGNNETEILQRPTPRNARKSEDSSIHTGGRGGESDLRRRHDHDDTSKGKSTRRGRPKSKKVDD